MMRMFRTLLLLLAFVAVPSAAFTQVPERTAGGTAAD